jgi:hypothetical protein
MKDWHRARVHTFMLLTVVYIKNQGVSILEYFLSQLHFNILNIYLWNTDSG